MPNFDVANSSSDYTHALGYSYDEDPKFMYCAEDMRQLDQANWWLRQLRPLRRLVRRPVDAAVQRGTATGSLISVNSWGYTNQPGMAGPKLSGTSASCVFTLAKSTSFASVPTTDGNEGTKFTGNCP